MHKINPIILGDFIWNSEAHELILLKKNDGTDTTITLTKKQNDLLICLQEAYPNVLKNKDIIEKVWEGLHVSPESLPRLVNRTRKVLGDTDKKILVNSYGYGYTLNFKTTTQKKRNITTSMFKLMNFKALNFYDMVCFAFILVTLFNFYGAVKAVYYKNDFEHVIQAKEYPQKRILSTGKTIITINGHECIYEKSQLLLQCQKNSIDSDFNTH